LTKEDIEDKFLNENGMEYVDFWTKGGQLFYRGERKVGSDITKHGYGLFSNQTIPEATYLYQGYFVDDIASDPEGNTRYANGDYHVGKYLNGKPNGLGHTKNERLRYVYKGGFKDGNYSGEGVLVQSGEYNYTGNFSNGKFDGFGEIFWQNGTHYKGQWS
jgi:hypothetical protein